jgi:hypothetical protein
MLNALHAQRIRLDAAPTELARYFPTCSYKYFAPTEQRVHRWPAP